MQQFHFKKSDIKKYIMNTEYQSFFLLLSFNCTVKYIYTIFAAESSWFHVGY